MDRHEPQAAGRAFRAAWFLILSAALTSCVGYPRIFLAGREGRVSMAGAAPQVKISIVKDCETQGESYETFGKSAWTSPDSSGRYRIGIAGFAWNWFNLIDGSYCRSRVQTYDCRADCRPIKQ
ncbi:MAG: hypothetical protein KGL04_09225 [Elusimicrobia bacterium]|nr:hypothetical protein [Elusimicrobiota bacterium]MDE2314341.1 hypothetical protein [Elusimicrobiota bacterium]